MAIVETVAAPDSAVRPAPDGPVRRILRDRVGATALAVVLLFLLLTLATPLIAALYGKNPTEQYGQNAPGLLSDGGLPVLGNGGVSGDFWFGLEPGLGRDVFTQLLYGIRTSPLIAFASAAVTTVLGVLAGVAVGCLGGIADRLFGFLANVLLAFPTLLLLLALSPVIQSRLVDPGAAEPEWMQFLVLILVFAAFGWIPLALSLRATVRSLRERDFVQSARAQGASGFHVVVRELLPNVRSQLLVHVTMAVPAFVASEAVLSFSGVGITEPVPDWGRMIARGAEVFRADPTYMVFPGRRRFPGGRTEAVKAVDGVGLRIAPGETVGLVGESGSGKSTTSRVLAGLQQPTGGRVASASPSCSSRTTSPWSGTSATGSP